ncbi:MAG TPA: RHS repeat-associated core domain-containing protein, partial [Chthoniobacteraceae bacterium]
NNGDQYTAAGEETLTYDRDGRLTTRTQGGVTTTYSYDAFGQLTGITAPGSVVTFDYDAMGNRIGKTENGVRTDFAEDPFGLGTLFGEYQGATATHYASGLGVAARESAGSTAFYHFDAAGNTALVSGAAGAAVATYKYLPFGEIAAQTGGLAQPFTFNGQLGVQDDPGDLFHMRARAFDAELGRFTTRDPIGFTGGDTNIYRFAQNDPVNFNDPSGLLIPAVPASVAGQVVAGAPSTVSSFVNGLRVAGLYTASGTNAGLAGAGAGVVETGVATGLSTAGGLTAAGVLGLIGIGTVAGVGSAAVITTGAEALDSSFRNNRDAHAQRLGYPDPNEPHFTPEFVNEWGKNPYFTDLVKKGLADGQSDRDAILDAVRIVKKLGLDTEKKPDDKTESEVVRPSDPNNVIGPAGPGADPVPAIIAPGQFRFDGFVNSEADFPYTIQFENQPSATAPAQVVTVTQTLDADLDLTTFRFTSFGFGDFRITVPADADGTSFETIYDGALATLGVLVQVEAELNTVNGLLQVTFTSLDPLTNEVPADPFAGFLPANLVAPQGDGFLTYSVAPKAGLADGQEFTAIASIVFDTEDAISTPTVTNKLDDSAPTSQITAFASPTSTRQNIAVRWTSADNVGGSGLSGTTIFVSDNDGPLDELTVDDAGNALRFTGLVGHTYKFFSQAVDAVGNKEAVAALPDATITVIAPPLITAEGNKITLTDTDGDIYTVQLKGPAGAVLKYLQIDEDPSASVRGPLDFLVVENSTTQHSLSVSVKRAKDGPDADRLPDGDGIVSIGDVVINGSLSAFTAKASDLNVNGLTATGTVKTIGIRDLARPDEFAADPAITLGGTNVDQTTITARNIADGFTFTTPGIIKGVTAATIGDGLITAAGLGKLTTTLGAFDADLNLSGAVGAITVKGGVNTGNWQGATFGAITVNGGAFDADVTTVGAISKLTVKGGGASGQLSASKIGPVVITGGDFSGVISSVTSAETLGKTPALASLAITGGNLTGEIAALAKVGNVAVKADRSGVGGGLSGELSASSFGKVSLTGGSFSGSVTSLTAAATLAKTAALAGLSISGGDFTGDVRVLGAIGAISVLANQAGTGGNLTDASITAARIAAITVAKTAANSVVLAGADLGADHAFGGAADTFGSGSIGAIKIGAPRGTGTVVTNTLIGAGFTPGSDGIPRGSAADSIFGASEADQLTNLIASLTINGQADAASYFAAGRFKANPKIAGAAVDPSADPLARFLTV